MYSRTLIARTPMARLPWLIRNRFLVFELDLFYFIMKVYAVCTH